MSDDENIKLLIESLNKHIDAQNTNTAKLINLATKNIKAIDENIVKQMTATRVMIQTKYDIFGQMMSILMSMMFGLLVNAMLEPLGIEVGLRTALTLLVVIISAIISLGYLWQRTAKLIELEKLEKPTQS